MVSNDVSLTDSESDSVMEASNFESFDKRVSVVVGLDSILSFLVLVELA